MTIKAQALATLVINADGYSPTVTTGTSSDGSTTVTVTNKDGSTTTELVDGTARKDAADAAKSATDYISPQSVSSADDGIKVFPKSEKDNPKNYININSSSTDIYKNGKKIAQYSQGIIINDDDGNKVFSAELMNGKYINEHVSNFYHKKISAGVTTTLSFDLIVAPSGDIEGTIPVSNSFGELLGIMNVYSFIEAPQELSIPSEYGTGSVLVNSISYTNRTVTVSITNNTNIEIDFGTSAENADHMIWSYYMRDYGVATRCGGFWENDYTKAFAIGVGKDANNRENAFAVDWDGNTIMQGELAFGTAASAAATMANLGVADYVVEQGTSGIWTYKKYSSGVIECWTTRRWATPTLTMTAISSSGTYKSQTLSMPFPTDLFTDVENCFNVRFSFMSSGTYLLSVMNSAPSNSVLPVVIVKGGSSTSACSIYAHAVGRWK